MELLAYSDIRQEQGLHHRLCAEGHGAEGVVGRPIRDKTLRPHAPHYFFQRGRFGVSMEDVIETMTGVEIVDEDDVAVDMQAFAKEKSRKMSQR